VVWLLVKGYACAAEDAVNTEKSCQWHDFESGRFGKKPDHIYAAGMRYSAALVQIYVTSGLTWNSKIVPGETYQPSTLRRYGTMS